MVLTVSFVLSPVTGLFCHRRPRTNVVPKPGRADITSANLTPASGRQDHTTSPYAAASFVSSPFDRSRAFRQPALQPRCAPDAAASTASHLASLTIRIRPSVGRDAESSRCDLVRWQQIFFGKSEKNDSTPLSTNRPTGKSPRPRGTLIPACQQFGRPASIFRYLRVDDISPRFRKCVGLGPVALIVPIEFDRSPRKSSGFNSFLSDIGAPAESLPLYIATSAERVCCREFGIDTARNFCQLEGSRCASLVNL
jgi:hypothetical protein